MVRRSVFAQLKRQGETDGSAGSTAQRTTIGWLAFNQLKQNTRTHLRGQKVGVQLQGNVAKQHAKRFGARRAASKHTAQGRMSLASVGEELVVATHALKECFDS